MVVLRENDLSQNGFAFGEQLASDGRRRGLYPQLRRLVNDQRRGGSSRSPSCDRTEAQLAIFLGSNEQCNAQVVGLGFGQSGDLN